MSAESLSAGRVQDRAEHAYVDIKTAPQPSFAPGVRPLELTMQTTLSKIAKVHGHSDAVYVHLGHAVHPGEWQPRKVVATQGFNVAQYIKRRFLAQDPLVKRAIKSFIPFTWALHDLRAANNVDKPLFSWMAALGMHWGALAPVQDYARGPAFLNLFGARPANDVDFEAFVLAALEVHSQAADLLTALSNDPERHLNPREIQVLRMAAMGLTEQDTAVALALSRRGVQFHLHRAAEKLGAPNKTAAVAKAVAAGLIHV